MLNRRDFFTKAGSLAFAGGILGSLRLMSTPASDPDVPRKLDIRCGDDACIPVVITRHGEKLRYVVAWDLDADEVTQLRVVPDGTGALAGLSLTSMGKPLYDTLRGGVVVRWQRERTKK